MKSEGRLDAFSGALMTYGCYDLGKTPSVANWGDRKLILSTPVIDFFADNLAIPADQLQNPLASPLYGDLRGMPPALFQCGTYDPLCDDTTFMAARWAQAGRVADTIWYPGGVHAFDYFDTSLAQRAEAGAAAFLNRVFTG